MFFSALTASVSPVARKTIGGQEMLIPHFPENLPASPLILTIPLWSYRIPLYSPDPVVSPPVARPLTHISMITEYLSHERVDQALTFPRPWVAVLAHISIITEHFLNERAHQALIFPRPCGQRSIPSGFPSSKLSGRNCRPSHRSSGRHNSKTRARRSLTSPKRVSFQESSTSCRKIVPYSGGGTSSRISTSASPMYWHTRSRVWRCAFPHRRLHSVTSTKHALLHKKVQDELKDMTTVGGKHDFSTLADWQPY